jgi:hypothetical protein
MFWRPRPPYSANLLSNIQPSSWRHRLQYSAILLSNIQPSSCLMFWRPRLQYSAIPLLSNIQPTSLVSYSPICPYSVIDCCHCSVVILSNILPPNWSLFCFVRPLLLNNNIKNYNYNILTTVSVKNCYSFADYSSLCSPVTVIEITA